MKVISFLLLIFLAACGSHPDTPKPPLDAKDHQYRQCYDESDSFRNSNVKTTGRVVITFVVLPDGKIEDEKITETPFKDPNLNACLLEITRSLKIAPATNGAAKNVTKVLNFKTKTKMNE